MALFQKKPDVGGTSAPLYTLGAHKNVLVIGLGNPRPEYDGTRHNIGFAAVDHFAVQNDFPSWILKKDLNALITQTNMGANRVTLIKPTTFMNDSGRAAQAVQHFYRIYNQTTVAVYDELAIEFGQIRTRLGGTSAGHNGVKSLIEQIGDDFGRIRIGIGSDIAKKSDAAEFVLKKFSRAEQAKIPIILHEAGMIITEFVFGDSLPHETRAVL